MNSNKWAALLGAVVGFIFTRTPYMADGNLLITTVCVILASGFTLFVWKILKGLLNR
jgi:hypothetical protein